MTSPCQDSPLPFWAMLCAELRLTRVAVGARTGRALPAQGDVPRWQVNVPNNEGEKQPLRRPFRALGNGGVRTLGDAQG
jgi:hypothetical protein